MKNNNTKTVMASSHWILKIIIEKINNKYKYKHKHKKQKIPNNTKTEKKCINDK